MVFKDKSSDFKALEPKIRVKAMCLLLLKGHVFVADGSSMKSSVRSVEASKFYRVIGGSIDFDEDAETAVRREVREELNTEIEDLTHLDVVENRFTYTGERGHEVIFLYKGIPKKKDWDMARPFHIIEDTYEFDAVWVPIHALLHGEITLYPMLDYRKYIG